MSKRMTVFLAGLLALVLLSCQDDGTGASALNGEDGATPAVVTSDSEFLSDSPAEATGKNGEERPDGSVQDTKDLFGAVEECCTEVGKMDECWWEDAIADGVTCDKDADCEVGEACFKRAGASRGVCTCESHDCGAHGECVEGEDLSGDPLMMCGPSYCNGYYKCACFGGCEWWTTDTVLSTPDLDAAHRGQYCCEGTYPLGGENLIPYYSNTPGCDGSGGIVEDYECQTDTECDDSNVCTDDSCGTDGKCDHVVAFGAICGASTECMETSCDSTGSCVVVNYASDVICGDPTDDACDNPDHCDGVGNCFDNYEISGAACGLSRTTNECWDSDFCDGVGNCDTDNYVAAGTQCGADNAAVDCLDHDLCNGAGTCVNDYVAMGTGCDDLDTDMYPVACWTGLCGHLGAGPDNGICEASAIPVANDVCSGAVDLGTFGAADVGVLGGGSTGGTLMCASNDYSGAGEDCREWTSTAALGENTKDLVYSFDYVTPDTTAAGVDHQLYAFVIRLESDVQSTIYAYAPDDDMCPAAGGVASNRCISQHAGDGSSHYVWEHMVNTDGNYWSSVQQECSASTGVGYWWCDRDTWSYPDDITPCDDGLCTTTTAYNQNNMSQTVVFPRGDETGGTHTVYVFVDGAGASEGAHDNGNFSLTVEKVALNNGPCERINDDPRVYDITEVETGGSYYVGNLEDIVNSDHEKIADQACGTYDCAGDWTGLHVDHDPGAVSANQFWPNSAHYKIHRPAGSGPQQYCVRTEAASTGATDIALEVRMMSDSLDICGSDYTQVDSALGANGITFTANEGILYQVLVSQYLEQADYCAAGDGDCNYKLVVEQGACPAVVPVTTDLDCVAKPLIPNSCTAMGVTGSFPAGQVYASDGDGQYQGIITDACSNLFDITSSTWPGNDGPDTVILLTNDTAIAKDVSLEYWDHAGCQTSNCSAHGDIYSAIYACDGSLVDWTARIDNATGKAVSPDTCVPVNSDAPFTVDSTEHTFTIPANTTYQFVGSAWNMLPLDPACDGGSSVTTGLNYHVDVAWVDNASAPPVGVCGAGGYEYPVGSGTCWYKATPATSCDSACVGYGGCDLTALLANGMDATVCEELIDNLYGVTTGGVGGPQDVEGTGTGCLVLNSGTASPEYWVDSQTVTCDGASTNVARICACNSSGVGGLCTPGDERCNLGNYETCNSAGNWIITNVCSYGCDVAQGGCFGECVAGNVECVDAANYRSCEADYTWSATTATCPFFCDDNGTEDCAGECNAPDEQCDGLDYQTCNGSHYWVTSTVCTNGCDVATYPGTGCFGDCTPGETRCADANNVEICDGSYTWGAPVACVHGCDQVTTFNCISPCDVGGVDVGNYCWYMGGWGDSCTTVCSTHGGYNDATLSYAGSGGTAANCEAILDAQGYTNSNASVGEWGGNRGCMYRDDGIYVRTTDATTEASTASNAQRACACNTGSIECTVGDEQCVGSMYQVCTTPGFWTDTTDCAYACDMAKSATGCYGDCNPGAYTPSCPNGAGTPESLQCIDYTETTVDCVAGGDITCVMSTGVCGGVCAPGEKRCTANGNDFNVEICDDDGQWDTATPAEVCNYGCDDSNQAAATFCFGTCTPGIDVDYCSSEIRNYCDTDYTWKTEVCTNACLDASGACGGSCVPNDDQCITSGADDYIYQVCDGDGVWQDSITCDYACDATATDPSAPAAACSGECDDGDTQCTGSDTTVAELQEIQTCSGVTWGAYSSCPYVCDIATDACGGVCVPGERRCANEGTGYDVEICGDDGQWDTVSPLTHCDFGCDDADQGLADADFCYGECLYPDSECVDADNTRACLPTNYWDTSVYCSGGCDILGTGQCLPQCDSGGFEVGGYCWHLSAVGASCDAACASHGGYHDATRTYAGSGGTDGNCQSVLTAFSKTWSAGPERYNDGCGCQIQDIEYWHLRNEVATTSACSDASYQRACACGNGSPECTPLDEQCDSGTYRVCNMAGFWVDTVCPYGCDVAQGGCYGDCDPVGYTDTCVDGTTSRQCIGYQESDIDCDDAPTTYVCQSSDKLCGGVCAPGTDQCSGSDYQVCSSDGQWVTATTCANGCDATLTDPATPAAACHGSCNSASDSDYCGGGDGETRYYCDTDYEWHTEDCTFACRVADGSCGGSCVPDADQCVASGDDFIYQACDGNGVWQDAVTCPYACDATATDPSTPSAACSGECDDGDTRCTGSDTTVAELQERQTCTGITWGPYDACTNVCDTATDDCGGVCVPGERRCVPDGGDFDVQTCTNSGQWNTTPTEDCSYGCDASNQGAVSFCYGECETGDFQCLDAATSQECIDYSWSPVGGTTCPGGCDVGLTEECLPACTGEMVGGYCWYLSASNASCDDTCSSHGGYNDATKAHAGSDGSDADCQSVLTALGESWTAGPQTYNDGCGCQISDNDYWLVRNTVNTTSSCAASGYQRACACNDGSIECTAGEERCNAGVYQYCNAGYWDDTACAYGCDVSTYPGTGCYGNCSAGDQYCADASNLTECVDYSWTTSPCPVSCDTGTDACIGECAPVGSLGCSDGATYSECLTGNLWGNDYACPYYCDESGTDACAGECIADVETTCDDASTERTCGLDYTWASGATQTCALGCEGSSCKTCTAVTGGGSEAPVVGECYAFTGNYDNDMTVQIGGDVGMVVDFSYEHVDCAGPVGTSSVSGDYSATTSIATNVACDTIVTITGITGSVSSFGWY